MDTKGVDSLQRCLYYRVRNKCHNNTIVFKCLVAKQLTQDKYLLQRFVCIKELSIRKDSIVHLFSCCHWPQLMGSLSNDDKENNKDGKTTIGLVDQQNSDSTCALSFLYTSLLLLHDHANSYLISCFVEDFNLYMNKIKRFSNSFLKAQMESFRSKPQRKSPTFDELSDI